MTPEQFKNASEFLTALDVSSDNWLPNSSWNSPWVFRGQRDADWPLTPAAWREGNTPALKRIQTLRNRASTGVSRVTLANTAQLESSSAKVGNLLKAYSQARAEFQVILEFIELADQLGHPVPGADTYLRLSTNDYIADIGSYPYLHLIPEPEMGAALAQHHGIPTRATDWTQNPQIAAFFAAQDVSEQTDAFRVAVWAVRPDLLTQYIGDTIQLRPYCQFKPFHYARSHSEYIRAQEGLSIFPISGCAYFTQNGVWPTLEEYAANVANTSGQEVLRKLTLPHAQVGKLLQLLWARGVSRGHLMPTYDNVTASLLTKWDWWDY